MPIISTSSTAHDSWGTCMHLLHCAQWTALKFKFRVLCLLPVDLMVASAGKHSHRRVPCWPVSGLCLHITFGEQLLQVQELDICGTTKVRWVEHCLHSNTISWVMPLYGRAYPPPP